MTIKEFAQKYEISYSLAQIAARDVKPVATMRRDYDLPEDEIYKNLQHILSERSLKYADKISEINKQKSRLRWIRCNKK